MPFRLSVFFKIFLTLLLLHIPLTRLQAQTRLFTSDHELSSSLITSVVYDKANGFIWVATEDGLNRYDGSKFTVYKHEAADSTSLADNFVSAVAIDGEGRILVGSHFGLQVYDPVRDCFSAPIPTAGHRADHKAVSQILVRKSGSVVTLGDEVRYLARRDDGTEELRPINPSKPRLYYQYGTIDSNDNLWMGLWDGSVMRVAPDGTETRIPRVGIKRGIAVFAENPADGAMYLGKTNGGLYRFDPAAGVFEHILVGQIRSVKSMRIDGSGRMLLGSDGEGLKGYNPYTGELTDMAVWFDGSDKLKIHDITKDEYGNLWLGVFQRGLLMVPDGSNSFHAIGPRSFNPGLIGSACVMALCVDRDGTIWLGTDTDGIYALERDGTSARHYVGSGIPAVVTALYETQEGDLLLGSYGDGMGRIDRKTGRYTKIHVAEANGDPVVNVYNFTSDPHGNIVVSSMGSGLIKLDPRSFIPTYNTHLTDSISRWISVSRYSRDGHTFWIGTFGGINWTDRVTKEVGVVAPGAIVFSMIEDSNGNIWAGTSSGLVQIDGKTRALKRTYTTADGLPSNTVYAIEASGSDLWMSTNAGLAKFTPATGQFATFTVSDGLPGNEFYKNVSFRSPDGTLYFGGTCGMVYFDPEEISATGVKHDVRLTDFYVHGQAVRAGMMSGGRSIIDRPVYEADTFRLGWMDNSFSVELNIREFEASSKIKLLYSLDGGKWELASKGKAALGATTGTTLNFSHLNHGEHTLRIKALDGDVESDPRVIIIDIAAPWYATWWAKLLEFLLIVAVIAAILFQVRRRSEAKVRETALRHEDEIKEAKLQFFTNISHEIRTPMSLVISPVQKLISTDQDPDRQRTYRTVLRNSKRIMRLINELMDLRKIDKSQMRLHFTEIEMVGFIDDLCDTFSQTATERGIDLRFDHHDFGELKLWADRANFDKVLMNLISNAIKFTPKGGSVVIGLQTEGETAVISVTDSGPGIPVNERERIFQRFYQVAGNKSGGTGIGLHLVYSLMKLHHGSVSVTDAPEGSGSRFEVRLPLGCGHLRPEELESTDTGSAMPAHTPEQMLDYAIMPQAPTTDEGEGSQRRGVCIFVVEDDEEVRKYLHDELSQKYCVKTFANGEEALAKMLIEAPALVISDVMMPEMDGLTLTSRIRHNMNLNHIPVILLTAKNREEDNLECLESGADLYLTKPFNIDILLKNIENLLDTRRRLRNIFSGRQSSTGMIDQVQPVSNDEKLMERIIRAVNKHLDNPDLTVETVASEVGISRVHLHRKLKELTNQTTRDFIRNIRLREAARLMRDKKINIAEVCDLTGFRNPGNFSSAFKTMYGMSPTAYVRLHHPAEAPAEVAPRP